MRRPPHLQLYLTLFSLTFHGFVGWRLVQPLSFSAPLQLLLWGLLLLSALLVPAALLGRHYPGRYRNLLITWGGYGGMGLVSTLFVLALVRDLVLLLLWLWQQAAGNMQDLTLFDQSSALSVWVTSVLISLAGFWNVRRAPRVVDVQVPIADLPTGLHGFTIAQISDIHVGPTIRKRHLQRIVDQVNALDADMVALTGDLVDGRVKWLGDQVTPLQNLRSRHGTFFVTGNHEYYSGAREWVALLQQLGLHVLNNSHAVLQHQGDALVIAGVTDYSGHSFEESHRSDPVAAVAHAPADIRTRILLAHQPRSIFQAQDAGYQLQLSGHTHGGQFLPWNWFVPLQQPFIAGLHRYRQQWIYVSRGTGYWGPPKRLAAPAEITRLVLVNA